MSAQESPWQRLDAKAKQLHTAYGQYIPAAAFLAGICFDSLALGRIDDEAAFLPDGGDGLLRAPALALQATRKFSILLNWGL